MPLPPVLLKRLAVVTGDGDDGLSQQTESVELVDQRAQEQVGPQDRLVVAVRIARPELRGRRVVEVLVRVHEVEIQEETLVAEIFEEVARGPDQVLVRAQQRVRGRIAALDVRALATGLGAHVDLESLREAEVRGDPSVPPDSRGAKARRLEDLRGQRRLVGQSVAVAEDPVVGGQGAGPERGHRRLGPARLGDHVPEDNARATQQIDVGAGRALVAVEAQPVGPQGIDQNEHDVHVVAFLQGRDRVDALFGARGKSHLELARDRENQQNRRADEIGPRGVEPATQHVPRTSGSGILPAARAGRAAKKARPRPKKEMATPE